MLCELQEKTDAWAGTRAGSWKSRRLPHTQRRQSSYYLLVYPDWICYLFSQYAPVWHCRCIMHKSRLSSVISLYNQSAFVLRLDLWEGFTWSVEDEDVRIVSSKVYPDMYMKNWRSCILNLSCPWQKGIGVSLALNVIRVLKSVKTRMVPRQSMVNVVWSHRYKSASLDDIGGLEHLKIETRLIDEKFANVMGEYDLTVRRTSRDGSGSVHGQIARAELLNLQKSGQFPDDPVRIKVTRIHYVTSQTY